MQALDRKLLRDIWHMRGQVLAIGLVIGSGVAVLIMSLSTLDSLNVTTQAYYERYRFADVFANAKRAPDWVARSVAELPGVQTVETRVSRFATLDIEGFAEPVIGRLISIPENGQPKLNRLALQSGRWIRPLQHDEVIVSAPFAEKQALRPGDSLHAVINGHRRKLTIVGTALSPEFVYALGPGALLPDDKRYGILWMSEKALEAAFDLDGAFNDISVSLLHGTAPEPIIQQLDQLLKRFGGTRAIPRADQISNWFVMNEIEQLRTLSTILPAFFLGVAIFLTHMVLSRLIATERSEIGLLKAFGYRSSRIALHYMKLAVITALIGVIIGWILGVMAGRYNTEMYTEFFRFPLLIYRPSMDAFVIGTAISLTTAIAGALGAMRAAAKLPPATAMQPPAPPSYRRGGLGLAAIRWFDEATHIALRQICRWPVRSGLTSVGIALSVGLLIMAFEWTDSIDYIERSYFFDAQRQSMAIGLAEPQSTAALSEFRHLPGVIAVEPKRTVGADFSVKNRKHRGGIIGVAPGSQLQPVYDETAARDMPIPDSGLLIANRLARKLEVTTGDEVWVEILEGRRPGAFVPVAGTFETQIAMPAYMNLDELNRLLGERPMIGYANLLVDSNAEEELFAKLKEMPAISAIMLRRAAIEAFHETLGSQILIFVGLFAGFACALGFGVTYNSTRIALSERGRELATLRVLGFTPGETAYILLSEMGVLILVALPLGCVFGWGLCLMMASAFDTELFRVPLIIDPSTYGMAVLFALFASVVSAWLVGMRVNHLDIIRVLKTRE